MRSKNPNIRFPILVIAILFSLVHIPGFHAETLEERINKILRQMTMEEKILSLHQEGGMNTADNVRLGVPGFLMADGPHGVREGMATSFPVGIAMAATWDTALVFKVGIAMGEEFRGKGRHQALGPCMDLCRDPRNGRSPESGGEDPYLCARITTAMTRGIQSTLCTATTKHYNCKHRQLNRFANDYIVNQRNLMEHYGLNFRTAVQLGGTLCVMNAYNLINGEKCAENADLLTAILKEKWGFPFYVVSDWGSIWNSERAIKAGCDICMGSDKYQNDLPGLAASGAVPESVIDEAVRRVLRTKIVAGMLDDYPPGDPDDVNSEAHQRLCLDAGRKCIVLLKNQDAILPLDKSKIIKIAVIGPSANVAQIDGQGSSFVTPFYSVSPRKGIETKIGADRVLYAKGCDINSASTSGFPEAVDKAKQADAVVFFGGLDGTQEGEGLDRVGDSIDLPGKQQDLINALAAVNPNLVVVLESGGICGIQRCADNIKGLLYAFYPGQEGGNALADVLFGDVNPGGKLPVTIPIDDFQLPPRNFDFNDDYGCGYRWFDEKQFTPRYAFGFGLSYTTFQYTNLVITPASVPAGQWIDARADVQNTGFRTGDEVAQMYLTDGAAGVWMPKKQLKGFKRITLNPGETQTVTFTLTPDELYYFDENADSYEVEPGTFTVRVGGSSDNLPLSGQFEITSADKKPDLIIANVRLVPPQPVRGSEVMFIAAVLNRGTGPSPSNAVHKVLFRVNGQDVAWSVDHDRFIPAGGMALVCANTGPSGSDTWKTGDPGTYTVEAVVDPDNAISETIETNNFLTVYTDVRPQPPINIALHGKVSVSSVEKSDLEGEKAVDGSFSTRWSSAFSDPQSITVDLGAVYEIDQMRLYWENAYGKEYVLRISTDGSQWTDAAYVTDGDGGVDKFNLSAEVRYVRMVGLTRGTQWGYSLYEFQVFSNTIAAVTESEPVFPETFTLEQNYPNPFNKNTFFVYVLKRKGRVQIRIFDASGRFVKSLVDEEHNAGRYEVRWNGSDDSESPVTSGVYLVRMNAGGFSATKKMLVLR